MKNYLVIFGLISSLSFVSCADPTGPLDPICETFNFPEPPCCGASGLAARIKSPVERVNRTAGEFPWWITVKTFVRGKPGTASPGCLGALINSQWVLTAAHCVRSGSAIRVTVSVNGIRPDVLVDKYVVHPFYEGGLGTSGGFDSALLHMVEPVSYSSIRLPICLPLDHTLKHRNFKGENVTIVGMGNGRLKIQTKVRNSDATVITVPKFHQLGDSGGPLIKELDNNPKKIKAYYVLAHLMGFYSWIGVMIKTTAYMEWLKATIQLHNDDNLSAFGRNPI